MLLLRHISLLANYSKGDSSSRCFLQTDLPSSELGGGGSGLGLGSNLSSGFRVQGSVLGGLGFVLFWGGGHAILFPTNLSCFRSIQLLAKLGLLVSDTNFASMLPLRGRSPKTPSPSCWQRHRRTILVFPAGLIRVIYLPATSLSFMMSLYKLLVPCQTSNLFQIKHGNAKRQ